ncbi:TetR/AcrR family transcriptional regulator [Novosphingobium cyanobacteriorum]|uniref:TetR/AcrR family transcriptional regulator n=1 Tax=Novosphingobium cyanobacteriorum TaxID=3024215 RepID=A0ABT6CEN0_9SPHN|nr:TetR/AcrR family transcriptional regulator [Novosphingobium cyanobacteriorum]MDF8332380.1 TetR/AcrR family transcriptional regulator [Novosphingobium cyanobacteriorum]
MPKIVNHEARRQDVAEIAARLIASVGIEGTKVRDIARIAGCSTSVVSHYFSSKHDLLLSAYRQRMEQTVVRIDTATRRGERLLDTLAAVLPLDTRGNENWRIWLAFWGLATTDATFLQEQRRRSREAVDLFHRAILATGAMEEGAHSFNVAQALLSAASGIAAQAVYDPERWTAERQIEILALHINAHLGSSVAAAAVES